MMNTKYLVIGGAVLITCAPPGHALELVDKKLELYGKAHVSLDFSDPDVAAEDSQTSVSSNSSRIGFRGQNEINANTTLLWQFEQEVDVTEVGAEFATRNSFVGLKGNLGKVLAGHYDTPSKTLGSRWDMFADTVGDRRAILGAYTGYGNVLNDRADNAVLYGYQFDALQFDAMYSADPTSADVSGGLDNNDFDLISMSLTYSAKQWMVGAAAENWSLDPVNGTQEVDNIRVAASYSMDRVKVGAIFESTDSDDAIFKRDAYGLNARFDFNDRTDIRLQYLVADDHEGLSDSGAQQMALGAFRQLDKAAHIYAVYSMTDNDANAQYQGIDGGHGDELETGLGGSPSSFSFGAVYKF